MANRIRIIAGGNLAPCVTSGRLFWWQLLCVAIVLAPISGVCAFYSSNPNKYWVEM